MSEIEINNMKNQLRGRIEKLLSSTPSDIPNWSYQKAQRFKRAAEAAQKAYESKRANLEKLISAENELRAYY
jgi:hypothetical protein